MSEPCGCVGAPPRSIDVPRLQIGGAVMFGLGLVLTFAVSLWFSIMVDLAIGAALLVLAVISARFRCERCVGAVHVDDLEPSEQRSLRMQQGLGLAFVAAMSYGALWAKGMWDAERGVVTSGREERSPRVGEENEQTVAPLDVEPLESDR